jgi:hypothetical protein
MEVRGGPTVLRATLVNFGPHIETAAGRLNKRDAR